MSRTLSFFSLTYLPISKEVVENGDEEVATRVRCAGPPASSEAGLFGKPGSLVKRAEDLSEGGSA